MGHLDLHGNWALMHEAMRQRWPRLSDDDIIAVAGERAALVRLLKALYGKTYGELEREVTEFDLRDIRAANSARPSLGIGHD